MTSKYATLLLLFFTFFSFSQNTRIDSLQNILKKNNVDFNSLIGLSEEYQSINFKKSIDFTNKALLIAKKNKDNNNIAICYGTLSKAYFCADKLDSSLVYNKLAMENVTKNDTLKAGLLSGLSSIYYQKGNMKEGIENANNALKIFSKLKRTKKVEKQLESLFLSLSNIYSSIGAYKEAFENAAIALKLAKKSNNKQKEYRILNTIGNIYDSKGDYKKASETYLQIISNYPEKVDTNSNISIWFYNLASSLIHQKKFKEADIYLDKAIKIIKNDPNKKMLGFALMGKSLILIDKKDILNADIYILKARKIFKDHGVEDREADCLLVKADIYKAKNNFIDAENAYKEALDIYKKFDLVEEVKETYEQLSDLKLISKDYKKSLEYYKKYTEIQETIYNQEKNQATTLAEIKYQTAQKEAKIKTQQLEIQQEKTNKYLAFGGIGLLVITLFGGFVWFKNNQKNTQLTNQNQLLTLQQNLNAMQLDNLNKQLDPHEIKNILACISPEIQRNAPDAYNKMTKLLNITRASLNSTSITDSIENQLQQIDDYLSLEKTVLPVLLNYSIINTVDNHKQIPRLLLKNLVENAIKHGIKNKKEGGEINITLSEKDNAINISVDDTGSGRQQAISLDSGIGTSTYINLFETLNKTNDKKASFEIIDKQQGTKVEIIIPIDYKYV